jgi:uncharacterized membrane protein
MDLILELPRSQKGVWRRGLWIFFASGLFLPMGFFVGVIALYLTRQPPLTVLLGHQAAEIVLFCLPAIALFAVIATM